MVLKLLWAQKWMLWLFEKSIFQFFANFWVTKLKPFSAEVTQSVQNYLNQNLVIGSFWAFEKSIFQFSASFWVTKLKPFSGKVRQSVQNYSNQNMVIGSFLVNGFEATLSWKANVVSVWKEHFSVFCKYLGDEVETILWESEAKCSKLFKSKFGHRKLLRKWFWSYFELKNECCDCLKRAFFSFLQIFEWRSWNHFLGKRGNAAKTFSIKSTLLRAF